METPHCVRRAAAEVAVRRDIEHADCGKRLLEFVDGFSRAALLAARDVSRVVIALLRTRPMFDVDMDCSAGALGARVPFAIGGPHP